VIPHLPVLLRVASDHVAPAPTTSVMDARHLSAPRRRPTAMPPYRRTDQHTSLRQNVVHRRISIWARSAPGHDLSAPAVPYCCNVRVGSLGPIADVGTRDLHAFPFNEGTALG
jgi:hypothetical protein